MTGREDIGWIEQNERVPAPADLDGVLHCSTRRHRVEDAGGRFLPKLRPHLLHHALEIAAELSVMMVRGLDRNILPVVAKIEYQHIEPVEQVLPIGKISVRGEAIAMGDQQAIALRISMPPHANHCAVFQGNLKGHARGRDFETHSPFSPLWLCRRARMPTGELCSGLRPEWRSKSCPGPTHGA